MDFMISHFCDEQNHQPLYQTRRQSVSDRKPKLLSTSNPNDESSDSDQENRLPPETELGNIEYKAKLVNPTSCRIQHLITQMKWRLREGQGEMIYEIGVEDGGAMSGLTDSELNLSLTTLRTMSQALDASMVVLTEKDVTPKGSNIRRTVVEVLVRKVPDSQQFIELRLAVVGACDVGKSTLCGVLSQGNLDDGSGSARLNLFRYPHEVRTGKTSSVCTEVIGFDNRGKLVNYAQNSLEEMVEKSTKLVSLIDLAGDSRYEKTTIHGLTGYKPHFTCLVVSADVGPTAETREHLGLIAALNIPCFVLITKKDLVDNDGLECTIKNVTTLLRKAGLMSREKRIKKRRDAVVAAQELCNNSIVPIVCVSSVTGEGFRLLRTLLNCLSTVGSVEARQKLSTLPAFFTIEELYNVPHVGQVVGGMLSEGQLHEGNDVLLGPLKDGSFEKVTIGSIRRSRQAVGLVNPGEAASIALNIPNTITLRRGMILASINDPPAVCYRFKANLLLLFHLSKSIYEGFQATVYVGSVCATATIVKIEGESECVVQGKYCQVEMCWAYQPEVIRAGSRIILRQGRTKGMGEVLEIIPINQ